MIEKVIHSSLIAILFSLLNWFIIDKCIITIELWRYCTLEILFVISMKLYKFTIQKLKLH